MANWAEITVRVEKDTIDHDSVHVWYRDDRFFTSPTEYTCIDVAIEKIARDLTYSIRRALSR